MQPSNEGDLPSLEILESRARVFLRRPEKRNRLGPTDLEAIMAHLGVVEAGLTATPHGPPRRTLHVRGLQLAKAATVCGKGNELTTPQLHGKGRNYTNKNPILSH